jgi:hypothetical protein
MAPNTCRARATTSSSSAVGSERRAGCLLLCQHGDPVARLQCSDDRLVSQPRSSSQLAGVGFGAVMAKARVVNDEMFVAASQARSIPASPAPSTSAAAQWCAVQPADGCPRFLLRPAGSG